MANVESHVNEALKELDDKVPVALEKIGLVAERYAKKKAPVDTGLLRNSITHAVGGKPFSTKSYHASKGSARGKDGKRKSAGSRGAGNVKMGFYSGSPGAEGDNTVYIGTNVEYAPYVELGARKQRARPYLKPAMVDHKKEYERILRDELGGNFTIG